MDGPTRYEIDMAEPLIARWSAWFDGLDILPEAGGETTLRGPLVDQAALFGLLAKIHAFNLTLLAVYRLPAPWRRGWDRRS